MLRAQSRGDQARPSMLGDRIVENRHEETLVSAPDVAPSAETPAKSLDGKHVAVVGGAIGGAAVALLLAGAGARVTLLERVDQPRAVGAGILLQPNGLGVLYGL